MNFGLWFLSYSINWDFGERGKLDKRVKQIVKLLRFQMDLVLDFWV